jgi:FMN phosphatase YigB (HAD superfamily)
MIKAIHTSGKYMQVIGGSASTYVTAQAGSQGVGNLRFNTSQQRLEVYDGMTWLELNMPHASVGLNAEAEQAIDWVRRQMEQEHRLEALAREHPAVADALEAVQQAQERVRIVAALVQE